MDNLADIAQQLDGAHRDRDGWRAKCPVHNGKGKTSLRLWEHDGKVYVKCFSGCPFEEIRKTLNLTPPPSDKPLPEEIYSYTDDRGNLLYQAVRLQPKGFFQRQPHPSKPGEYVNNMKGVTRVLYRLAEVQAAAEIGKTIYLVEGERDVETLRTHGLVATTNAGGAGKWEDAYSVSLKGADIVLIPDHDEAGERHADLVSTRLAGFVKSLRRVELPDLDPGGDVSDWLQTHSLSDLEALIQDLPPTLEMPHLVLKPFSEIEPTEVQWLWEPYIPLGKLTLLEGDPGNGKTYLTLAIAAALSTGNPLPSQDGVPSHSHSVGSTLFITGEDDPQDTIRPRLDKMEADLTKIIYVEGWTAGKELEYFTFQQLQLLGETIADRQVKLVVIDPIDAFLGAGVDMHRSNEVRPLMTQLSRIANQTGCVVVLVRHWNKSGQGSARYRGLGSIAFTAAVRSQIVVGEALDDENLRIMAHSKHNLSEKGVSQVFQIKQGQFLWAGTSEIDADTLAKGQSSKRTHQSKAAHDWLKDFLRNGPVSSRTIYDAAEAVGIKSRTLEKAKSEIGILSSREGSMWYWMLPRAYGKGGESYD